MPKARKRAPGAGRKPRGEYVNRTASFTMRMSSELRVALGNEAKRSDRSLSQEVEHRLRQSLELPAQSKKQWGPPHIKALAQLVSRITRAIELRVGASHDERASELAWHKHGFTHAALQRAIHAILMHFQPDGPITVPQRVEADAVQLARLGDEYGERQRKPEEIGVSCALGLLEQMRAMDKPPIDKSHNNHYADAFYVLPHIRETLRGKREDQQ